jgi:Carboxypeptidase regulatory-like domain
MKLVKSMLMLICLGCLTPVIAQSTTQPAPQSAQGSNQPDAALEGNSQLVITVVDDNGVPVVSAQVYLTRVETQKIIKGETDYAGHHKLNGLSPGPYRLRVEKEGFYATGLDEVLVGQTEALDITIHHEQELRETIDVVNSPPAIDPAKTASSETLTFREITNIPYPATRDLRNLLPFIPRVVKDSTGQVHINGSASYQLYSELDGFNISHPVNGLLEMRVSPDALRSIEVQSSRYSAEYGKGSGGVLSLATIMGDDRFRFSATDFLPSLQMRKGINFNNWTPRATFSGPLRKGRAWYFDAIDADYNLDIINDLPSGADRGNAWRLNNLAKAQVNLTPSNILSTGFLINRFEAGNFGLSRLNPLETTRKLQQSAYLLTVKDQAYLPNRLVVEFGFGVTQFDYKILPFGSTPYLILPEGSRGTYFKTSEGLSRRLQGIANLSMPPTQWHGRHEFRLGLDIDRITFEQLATRKPISVMRANRTLSREITFIDSPRFNKSNFEVGGFAQDRWSASDRWLMEFGLRLDWDQIIRSVLVGPRFASTYLLTGDGNTKLAAGVGVYYDSANLDLITRPLDGQRFDRFYAADGLTPRSELLETSFQVNKGDLKAPRYVNLSAGFEHLLPASIFMRVDVIARRGGGGFTFVNVDHGERGIIDTEFELTNEKEDNYAAVSITMRKPFKNGYVLFASYTRSSTRSSAVFDFNLDNVLFTQQSGGVLPWDTPNRLISWGWLPLIKKFDLAYSLEWRDGFPFSVINRDQQLVEPPNLRRFPDFFSLNIHVERRFRLLGTNLAVRAGFNNVTNQKNPGEVVNNRDSNQFLTFSGVQKRAFVGRIRFLGRK